MTRVLVHAALAASALLALAGSASAAPDPCEKHSANFAKQLKCYEARISRDAKDVDARVAAGALLTSIQKFPEAMKQFEAALALSPGSIPALNGKAMVLLGTGRGKEGIKVLEQALAQDPNNLQSVTNYGRVALEAGEMTIASDAFNHAMALNPNDTEANLGIGELHLSKGRQLEAIKFLAKAVEVDDSNARANYLLGLELTEKDPLQAIPFLERAAFLAPRDVEAWMALGRARFRAGQFRVAGQAFVEAGNLAPTEPVVYLEIGKVYVELDDFKEAEEAYLAAFENARQATPEVRAEIHLHMGILQQKKGIYKVAQTQYEKALTLKPAHAIARLNLGVVQSLQGNREGAVDTFTTLLEEYPEMKEARYNLAVTYLALGMTDLAQAQIDDLPEGTLKDDAIRRRNETKRRGVVTEPPAGATPNPQKRPPSKSK